MASSRLLLIIGMFATLFVCGGLQAQQASVANGKVSFPSWAAVLTVRQDLFDAPASGMISVGISRVASQSFAYKAVSAVGVLAPRGWHCFGTYGSGGETLLVSAEPIDNFSRLSWPKGLPGSPVQLS